MRADLPGVKGWARSYLRRTKREFAEAGLLDACTNAYARDAFRVAVADLEDALLAHYPKESLS
jgi:hypothetical protein